jgi:hypothetical protein
MCNKQKADRTPVEAGMKLRKQRCRPQWKPPGTDAQRWSAAHSARVKSWSKFVSEAYSSVELE